MSQPAGQPRIPLSRLQLQHPQSLAVFDDYEQAQRAVDYLSDREFPVQNVMIVGTDLRQVERVTGRLTSGRVLASGALSGAWMGLFFGSLMWFFSSGGMAVFLSGVIIGAVFGLVWAWLAYRVTGGARDFTSVTQVVATRYEVLVEHHLTQAARALLDDLRRGVSPQEAQPPAQGWGAGGAPPAGQPYGAGSPGAGSPVQAPPPQGGPGWGAPEAQASGPAQPEPPRYRTYGEALDAERAARDVGADADAGTAAEDAHDGPPSAPQAPPPPGPGTPQG